MNKELRTADLAISRLEEDLPDMAGIANEKESEVIRKMLQRLSEIITETQKQL